MKRDTKEKLALTKELVERLNRRRPAVALLEVMEHKGLATYDYDSNVMAFTDEINDSVMVQVDNDVARILFPAGLYAIANGDWEGGDIGVENIDLLGQCYATDSFFSVRFPSSATIDTAVDNVARFEFGVYRVREDGQIDASVLQHRGSNDVTTKLPLMFELDSVLTCAGRPFKSLDESGIHLVSDLEMNRNEMQNVRFPDDMQEKLAVRAYLMYGMEKLKPIDEVMKELEDEGAFAS